MVSVSQEFLSNRESSSKSKWSCPELYNNIYYISSSLETQWEQHLWLKLDHTKIFQLSKLLGHKATAYFCKCKLCMQKAHFTQSNKFSNVPFPGSKESTILFFFTFISTQYSRLRLAGDVLALRSYSSWEYSKLIAVSWCRIGAFLVHFVVHIFCERHKPRFVPHTLRLDIKLWPTLLCPSKIIIKKTGRSAWESQIQHANQHQHNSWTQKAQETKESLSFHWINLLLFENAGGSNCRKNWVVG